MWRSREFTPVELPAAGLLDEEPVTEDFDIPVSHR
jgi:hypothetical protein